VAHNPASEHLVVTGSADAVSQFHTAAVCSCFQTVALWDIRHLGAGKVHSLAVHAGDVLQVAWSPFHENVLASGGSDRRINVWDLSRIGMEQDPEDAEDGPPELLFVHGGHTARIADFAWDAHQPWLIASAADDNVVHIWKMADAITQEEDEDDDDEEDKADHLQIRDEHVQEEIGQDREVRQVSQSGQLADNQIPMQECELKDLKESVMKEAATKPIPDIVIDSPNEQDAKKIHLELE
jgi:WD40 repeat protein